jgi:hypothetical protein
MTLADHNLNSIEDGVGAADVVGFQPHLDEYEEDWR